MTMQSFKTFVSENSLDHHISNSIPLNECIFRWGSKGHLDLISEARKVRNTLNLSEIENWILDSDIGSFEKYYEELEITEEYKSGLTIFDIDDTLFHTTAIIGVMKDGEKIKTLTNQEFNTYSLAPGESFDFSEFRNADKFEKESQPIRPLIAKLKAILANAKRVGSDVIILTARQDFDDKNPIIKKFASYGIDIEKDVPLYRSGNEPGGASSAEKKSSYIRRFLNTNKYSRVRLIDDAMSNLTQFLQLSKEFPEVEFEANLVTPGSKIVKIKEQTVPLDLPLEEDTDGVELSSPKRGGSKKFYVYVKNDKGNVIKVQFGDTTGLNAKINNPAARKSFAARHRCAEKTDKTKPGYWSCRLPYFTKQLGLKGGGKFFW